jgi:hypothetical protein
MKTKSFWIGLGLIITLTVGGALVHGRLSNRWGPSQSMIEAGAVLNRIPEGIEGWELQPSQPLPEYARSMLECVGDISRSYVSTTTQASIGLSLILGPVGTIAVHSPEICFPSQNFRLLGERKQVKIRDAKGTDHNFWKVQFRSQDLEARLVHVYYAWSTGGPWSAPDSPRFAYAASPYLYKVQLVGYPSPAATKESEDPVPAFLSAFLPVAGAAIENAPLKR